VLKRPLTWTILVLIVWFGLFGALGSLAGKLSQAQKNDNAAFLPTSAESTQVNTLEEKFSESQSFPTFVVFVRPSGLTAADHQAIDAFSQQIPDLRLTDQDGHPLADDKTVGDYLASDSIVPVPSSDGKAVLVPVSLSSTKTADILQDGKTALVASVQTIRHAAAQTSVGLESYVTGPGGILADLFKVFGSLDTTLFAFTGAVVAIILILVYRSPLLWFVPLLSAVFALAIASGIIYLLAKNNVLTLNGQSQGILTVLVFGAATDYALLLVARYREELHRNSDHFAAMRIAWKGVVEPLVASAGTVSLGLLCLLFSELNSNKSTGPVAAIGIVCALAATLTLLPALLVLPSVAFYVLAFAIGMVPILVIGVPRLLGPWALILLAVFVYAGVSRRRGRGPAWAFWLRWPAGRWAFWPRIPRYGAEDEKLSGVYARVARTISRRARLTWVAVTLILLVAAFFVTTLKADGISQSQAFTSKPDSVIGQEVLQQHFPAGSGNPAVIIASADHLDAVSAAAKAVPGIAAVEPLAETNPSNPATGASLPTTPKVVDDLVQLNATLTDPADSLAAQHTVTVLRTAVHAIPGADAKVGGFTAINYDTQAASRRDRDVIIPIVLGVILVILMLLLRAVVGPVVLVLTVILSFAATMGICAIVFNHLFHFPGADSSFPLFAFVFLVALGVDYNIFLMTRVREESKALGTRRGILRGLTVTGGVITSAGVVLASTFSVLGTLPLVFLAELGFAVAFGVLLDTMVVRTLLVPALAYDIGRPIWWPSRLARTAEPAQVDETVSASAAPNPGGA
jgi:putative drug exporter of the RND superfamily